MMTIFVAHKLEAAPFIEPYQLKPDWISGLSAFVGPRVQLIVTGQGGERVRATLIRFLESVSPGTDDAGVFLNFGVAGSAEFARGTLVVIDEGCDRVDGVSSLARSCCLSVDSVTRDYPASGVVDMEYQSLRQCLAAAGLPLTTLKLVSDVPGDTVTTPDLKSLGRLIANAGPGVCAFSDMLLGNTTSANQ